MKISIEWCKNFHKIVITCRHSKLQISSAIHFRLRDQTTVLSLQFLYSTHFELAVVITLFYVNMKNDRRYVITKISRSTLHIAQHPSMNNPHVHAVITYKVTTADY